MELTDEQQKMLDGEMGEATQKSMELLVAIGKIYSAKNLVDISSAQIAGVSYKTIGDAGLEYISEFADMGAKVRVRAFLNPLGMDRKRWKEMGICENFAKKQLEILNAYERMDIFSTCTCTPYFIGIRPKLGEHIAWSESSAVSFANSVLGARTNMEGGPSALAAAICGFTPNFGLHLNENRISKLTINVNCELKDVSDFGALGYLVGKSAKNNKPAFKGIKKAREEDLKSLGAAMAASGSVSLYFVEKITPEWNVSEESESIIIEEKDILNAKKELNTVEETDFVCLGCPHYSLNELRELAEKLDGKKINKKLWVSTSSKVREEAERKGYVQKIEKAGGLVLADTCMVVSPLEEQFKSSATNSGKAAKYLPGFCKQRVKFGSLEEIL